MRPDFINEMYKWALECKKTNHDEGKKFSLLFHLELY